ncbi:MAG TPA: M1 family aminopeptidase/hydrolase [Thermoanaerobaculia bacterium]
MLQRRLALSLCAVLFLFAARQRAVHHPERLPSVAPRDAFSSANVRDVTTRHLALDLSVDFEARLLSGTATLTLENLTGATQLILDTYRLDIQSVTLDGATPAVWSLGTADGWGRPLTIAIQPATRTVTIRYVTMQDAAGLYWNTAEQTLGRKEPYLYSINESAFARTWIPIQDTPSMRMTWEAVLRVPPPLLALMSAENNPTSVNPGGVYTFTMSKTMPAYLIALAVGRLEFHPFDERTGVYAEPELMRDAARELAYMPDMVDAAERVIAPYPFHRYDILLMPPTYVLGGMEHPMLNFLHPFGVVSTNEPAQAEVRNLLAHELAHSWAGDLVTLANWNDVWLNEGITSYLTLRIIEEMVGPERAELQYYLDRERYARYAVQPTTRIASIMHRQVGSPDEGFGSTSYVKGELFMRTLEDLLGRPALDAFLDVYFSRFAWRWVDDVSFLATLAPFVPPNADLRLQEWLYEPGLPSNVTAATSSAIHTRMQQRSEAFNAGTNIAQLSPETWTDIELDLFFQSVNVQTLRMRMAEVDAALHLSARPAPPVRWLTHGLNANYAPVQAGVERTLMRGGPNDAIVSIYNALRTTPENRAYARAMFALLRKRYHRDVEEAVESMLNSAPNPLREAA